MQAGRETERNKIFFKALEDVTKTEQAAWDGAPERNHGYKLEHFDSAPLHNFHREWLPDPSRACMKPTASKTTLNDEEMVQWSRQFQLECYRWC